MRPLSALELLNAWERGLSERATGRALALLAAACPDLSVDDVAALDIGERDRWLMTLREWTFGSKMESVIHCATCNERLEWSVDVADLRVANQLKLPGKFALEVDRYHVSFRLPNSRDLAAIADCDKSDDARDLLLDRCVIDSRLDGQEVSSRDLPASVMDAVVERMEEADPQSDVELDLLCPGCGHRWQALFDIESFFWTEINAWARRILAEVHVLASAYGWPETEILNLSALRRQHYLSLVAG
jgi:hypothetical protein